MKISPNLHTNLTVLLQQKLLLQIFCSGKNNTSPPLFSAHQKTPPRLLYFLLTKKTLQHASLSLQKNQPHTAAAAHVFFPLKHKALMGLSGNGLKRIKIGLDPLYNLPLQPNIRGDYTLTSQLESMPADPAQSFSFSLVTTFVIISEGLKSV